MEQETKEAILRIQGAQMHLYENRCEGISLQLDISSEGYILIWVHNRTNGKNKIHTKGFVKYSHDDEHWQAIGRSQREYTAEQVLAKISKFIGLEI